MIATLAPCAPAHALDVRCALHDMVEVAILAPSAENTQPWRFRVGERELTVALDSHGWLASDSIGLLAMTGIGAAVENAVLAAREHGFEPAVECVVDGPLARCDALQPIARLSLAPGGVRDPLFAVVAQRCTSRRMSRRAVDQADLDRLSFQAVDGFDVRVDWVTAPSEIRQIAHWVGAGNRMRFEHASFHQEFYENLRFSPWHAAVTRDGLDVETLQLSALPKRALWWLRTWPRMRRANRLGFSRGVERQAAAEVQSSGALGLLSIAAATPEAMLQGGRAVERLWLAATAAGLGFHPTASLPVFLAYAAQGSDANLPPDFQRRAADISRGFFGLYPNLAGRTVQMAFRIGHAERPAVHSLRRPAASVIYA